MALPKAKPQYMINRETNEVYPYRQKLIDERPEFTPFYDAPPPVDRTTGLCVLRDKPDPLVAVEEGKKKTAEQADAEMRIKLLADAMGKMVKMDFATNNGMPVLSKLEKVVGFLPTQEERKLAFDEYTKVKEASE